jgi:hypothetical protein
MGKSTAIEGRAGGHQSFSHLSAPFWLIVLKGIHELSLQALGEQEFETPGTTSGVGFGGSYNAWRGFAQSRSITEEGVRGRWGARPALKPSRLGAFQDRRAGSSERQCRIFDLMDLSVDLMAGLKRGLSWPIHHAASGTRRNLSTEVFDIQRPGGSSAKHRCGRAVARPARIAETPWA